MNLTKKYKTLYTDTDKLVQGIPYIERTRAEIEAIPNPIKFQVEFDTDTGSILMYNGANWILQTSRTQIIKSLIDLPTPVGNVITLAPNKRYLISGIVDLGNNVLKFSDGSVLTACSPVTCGLITTSTGTMLSGIDVNVYIDKLNFKTSGSILDFKNLAKDKFLVISNCLCETVDGGTIEGFNDVSIDYNRHLNSEGGIEFIDVGHLTFTRQLYDDTVGGFNNYTSDQSVTVANQESVLIIDGSGIAEAGRVYKNISGSGILIDANTDYLTLNWEDITRSLVTLSTNGGTFKEINISNNRFQVANGYTGLNINQSTITTDSGAIYSNSFSGAGVLKIQNINIFEDSVWTVHNNKGIESPSIGVKMTTVEINNVINPKLGLIIFNTDEDTDAMFTSIGWVLLGTTPMLTTLFKEDWASGDFATNGWIIVNNGTNDWHVGTADAVSNTYSAYISNDGGVSSSYTINNTEISHFYKDFVIPVGITELTLAFDYKGEGEVGYDYMRVYKAPTTYTPTAGNLPVAPATLIGNSEYNNKSTWGKESISLGSGDAGTTIRLIFTWRNDGSVGTNPAAQLDNITLKYK